MLSCSILSLKLNLVLIPVQQNIVKLNLILSKVLHLLLTGQSCKNNPVKKTFNVFNYATYISSTFTLDKNKIELYKKGTIN